MTSSKWLLFSELRCPVGWKVEEPVSIGLLVLTPDEKEKIRTYMDNRWYRLSDGQQEVR